MCKVRRIAHLCPRCRVEVDDGLATEEKCYYGELSLPCKFDRQYPDRINDKLTGLGVKLCKDCREEAEVDKLEYRIEYHQRRVADDPDYWKEYREVDPDKSKKWREANKDELAAKAKKYREDHKDEIAAKRAKKYREDHKGEMKAKKTKHVEENEEVVKARKAKQAEDKKNKQKAKREKEDRDLEQLRNKSIYQDQEKARKKRLAALEYSSDSPDTEYERQRDIRKRDPNAPKIEYLSESADTEDEVPRQIQSSARTSTFQFAGGAYLNPAQQHTGVTFAQFGQPRFRIPTYVPGLQIAPFNPGSYRRWTDGLIFNLSQDVTALPSTYDPSFDMNRYSPSVPDQNTSAELNYIYFSFWAYMGNLGYTVPSVFDHTVYP